MPLRVVCLVLLLTSLSILAQNQSQQSVTPPKMSEVECTLNKIRLDECQKDLKQWQDWSTANDEGLRAYQRESGYYIGLAEHTTRETVIQYSSFGFGIGAGIVVLWMVIVSAKRFFQKRPWRPFTPDKKQLIAVLLASIWISTAGFIVAQDYELLRHPINLLAATFVLSLPAILFGGVSFWWYGRKYPPTN
jgi:hypothetical protein